MWCHNHARTRTYDTTHVTPILFLVTHTTLPVTRESAAAMQPTKPGVAYTQQSALVCATISPSVFVSPGAFPNERSIKGVGSQLEDPEKVPEERKATRGEVGQAVRERARKGCKNVSTHIFLYSAYCLHVIFLYVAKFTKFTVRDASFSLLLYLYLRLWGSVSKHCKGSLQHPIVTV